METDNRLTIVGYGHTRRGFVVLATAPRAIDGVPVLRTFARIPDQDWYTLVRTVRAQALNSGLVYIDRFEEGQPYRPEINAKWKAREDTRGVRRVQPGRPSPPLFPWNTDEARRGPRPVR